MGRKLKEKQLAEGGLLLIKLCKRSGLMHADRRAGKVESEAPNGLTDPSFLVGIAIAVVLGIAYMNWRGIQIYEVSARIIDSLKPRTMDLKPLKAPRMLELAELTDPAWTDSMLWGSYRSGLYFGMRTRAPKSLLTGLMWFDPDRQDTIMARKVRIDAMFLMMEGVLHRCFGPVSNRSSRKQHE